MNYTFNYGDNITIIAEFIDYLESLKKENKKLKEQYCERTDCCGRLGNSKKVEELIKENERLGEELEQLRENYKAVLKQRDDTNKSTMETIEKYQQENEKLSHYKLLYQKVKDRNDKAIEYVENNINFCKNDSKGAYDVCNIRIASDKKLLAILKSNIEEVSDEIN